MKTFFGVTSVSVLMSVGGVVLLSAATQACASTKVITIPVEGGAAADDAGPVGTGTVPDGGTGATNPGGGTPTGLPPAPSCMVTQPLDATKLPYKPPVLSAGQCTTNDLDAIELQVHTTAGGTALADIKAAVLASNATCAACLFTAETADKWGPVVEIAGGKFSLNSGGCMELVSGKASCGQAWQQWDECTTLGCAICTSDDDVEACYANVARKGGPCATATDKVTAECGTDVLTFADVCLPDSEPLPFAIPMRRQCIDGK